MSEPKKKVLIVGAGIAGLTLAIILKKTGIDCDIIEKKETFGPNRSGIVLDSRAFKSLQALSLSPEIQKHASEINFACISDHMGKTLARCNLSRISLKNCPNLSIPRGTLLKALSHYLGEREIWMNTTIQDIQNKDTDVEVTFSDGSQGNYVLVVGTDGIQSQIRSMFFSKNIRQYAGYSCWRFLARQVEGIEPNSAFELWGRGKRFGIVPLRHGTIGCYGTFNSQPGLNYDGQEKVEKLKSQFADFGGIVPEILEQIHHPNDILFDDIQNVYLNSWINGRILLIGDAAHALTPNFGQGAGLAIEDAARISQYLNFSSTLLSGLSKFDSREKNRVRKIQYYAHQLGRFAQMSSWIGCAIRNLVIRIIPNYVLLKTAKRAFFKE
ncbi:MAG: FAD-dependent monooxygenase [Fibrobacteria bacterium]|nr:FAD-dependent monooxygenase [Fibrobacteria bacterium]